MPILTAKTNVLAGAASAWTVTDGITNVIVGVTGSHYTVEYDLGSDMVYRVGGMPSGSSNGIVVAKANQVRVVNNGDAALDYEVFE